ncbi:transposase family protein [Staphylococcus canis]|uniref:Transposase n=2 Tax=Staphylococcus canis TaxID=2724942 RepID=A0ABS0T7U2_9STAP|nr:transposase family protein [Staphylococcus canis]MBI5974814.1 transposase [Staphylococcus canis]
MNYFILKTLNIKDENIQFEEKVEKSKFKGRLSLFYYGELSYTPSHCECCGEENEHHTVIKAGKKQSRITLPHISELPAYLILKKQRFYCKACNTYFTAQSPVVDKFCFISKNTKMAILNKATDIRSEASIAQDCSVSPTTVARFIDEAAESLYQSPHRPLPKHLIMDRFKNI